MQLTRTRPGARARTTRGRGRAADRTRLLAAGGVGAALAFFLDRDHGRRRRHMLRDRTFAVARRSTRLTVRRARYAESYPVGMARRAGAAVTHEPHEYDDVTLARKVETEIFRPAGAPKGSVNVNVHDGVVELRGEVRSSEQVASLGAAAQRVEGVKRVDNLLHTPGSPAKHSRVSTPEEVRERAAEPKAQSRFARNPATAPPPPSPSPRSTG
jgi:hypothetical protein